MQITDINGNPIAVENNGILDISGGVAVTGVENSSIEIINNGKDVKITFDYNNGSSSTYTIEDIEKDFDAGGYLIIGESIEMDRRIQESFGNYDVEDMFTFYKDMMDELTENSEAFQSGELVDDLSARLIYDIGSLYDFLKETAGEGETLPIQSYFPDIEIEQDVKVARAPRTLRERNDREDEDEKITDDGSVYQYSTNVEDIKDNDRDNDANSDSDTTDNSSDNSDTSNDESNDSEKDDEVTEIDDENEPIIGEDEKDESNSSDGDTNNDNTDDGNNDDNDNTNDSGSNDDSGDNSDNSSESDNDSDNSDDNTDDTGGVNLEETKVSETFINTRDIEETYIENISTEMFDTREVTIESIVATPMKDVNVAETYKTEVETFTNTRVETQSEVVTVEKTRSVVDTETMESNGFTEQGGIWSKVIQEDFENIRTIDGEDVIGTRDTDVIDSQAMIDAGYYLKDGEWGLSRIEYFENIGSESYIENVSTEMTATRETIESNLVDTPMREIDVAETYETITETFTNTREVLDTDEMLANGYYENDGAWYKDNTITITDDTTANLNQAGASVTLTLNTDTDIDLNIKSFKTGKDDGEITINYEDGSSKVINIDEVYNGNNGKDTITIQNDDSVTSITVSHTGEGKGGGKNSQEFKVEGASSSTTETVTVEPIMKTEEFEDTREVVVVDIPAHTIEVIDLEEIASLGLVEENGLYYEQNTVTEEYTYFVDVPTEMSRDYTFTDSRYNFEEAEHIIYTQENYVIDENIYTETFTDTRDVTVIGDVIMIDETYTEREVQFIQVDVEFEDTRNITVVDVPAHTIEVIDYEAVSEQGLIFRDGLYFEEETIDEPYSYFVDVPTEMTRTVTESFIDSTTVTSELEVIEDVSEINIQTTLNIPENGGSYGRVLNLNDDNGSNDFTLAFDKDGDKLRLFNAELKEQVTLDVSEKFNGTDFDVDIVITDTSATISDGVNTNSINWSREIEINPVTIEESPDGKYVVDGTVSNSSFVDDSNFENDILIEEIDFEYAVEDSDEVLLYTDEIDMDDLLMNDEDDLISEYLGDDGSETSSTIQQSSTVEVEGYTSSDVTSFLEQHIDEIQTDF
jgi:hypothetical protein